jgi:hypothetical protein
VRIALGTRDVELIEQVAAAARSFGPANKAFEVQMLHGIRVDQQRRLARAGFPVRDLISYGTSWYAWYMRRWRSVRQTWSSRSANCSNTQSRSALRGRLIDRARRCVRPVADARSPDHETIRGRFFGGVIAVVLWCAVNRSNMTRQSLAAFWAASSKRAQPDSESSPLDHGPGASRELAYSLVSLHLAQR